MSSCAASTASRRSCPNETLVTTTVLNHSYTSQRDPHRAAGAGRATTATSTSALTLLNEHRARAIRACCAEAARRRRALQLRRQRHRRSSSACGSTIRTSRATCKSTLYRAILKAVRGQRHPDSVPAARRARHRPVAIAGDALGPSTATPAPRHARLTRLRPRRRAPSLWRTRRRVIRPAVLGSVNSSYRGIPPSRTMRPILATGTSRLPQVTNVDFYWIINDSGFSRPRRPRAHRRCRGGAMSSSRWC